MRLVVLCLALLLLPASAQAPVRPVISHDPPATVTAGQPLRLIARVSHTGPLSAVNLHLAQSAGASPVRIPMRPAGAGVYVVTIEPTRFEGLESFRYYIEARDEAGVWGETNWATVRVIGGNAAAPERSSWKKPVLIGAGAAVVLGTGIALSGGGGGGSDVPTDGSGDPADNLIIRTASDSVSSPAPILPRVTTVDVASELAGRTIRRVRVRLEFDGVDGGAETYEISYNGATVLSGSATGPRTEQVDVLGSADTQVVIRVLTSTPVNGVSAFSWNATVTYFLN